MNALNILIVEDELLTAQRMKQVLEAEGYIISDIAASGSAALESVKRQRPDMILMDIQLEGEDSGIVTAGKINRNYRIPIIYITQKTDPSSFADAIRTAPLNFLHKPFTRVMLLRAVSLVAGVISQARNDKDAEVYIHTSSRNVIKLRLYDILYFQAKGVYTTICYMDASGKVVSLTLTLSSNHVAEQISAPDAILKVHRSYFVNFYRISKYEKGNVFIKDKKIPVSKTYRDALDEKIKGFTR